MSELAALRQIVGDLAARVTAIEYALTVEHAALRRAGFTGCEAALLALILKREIVSRDAAMMMLYGAACDDAPNPRIVDVYLSRMRTKLRDLDLPTPITSQAGGWWFVPGAKQVIRRRLDLAEAVA